MNSLIKSLQSLVTTLFGKLVALIGGVTILLRRFGDVVDEPALGTAPTIPNAEAQNIMTLKMPSAKGWQGDHVPDVAPGLQVNAFAIDLRHPRWVYTLPNNDVLVAESSTEKGVIKTAFDFAIYATMRRIRAVGVSANRVTLLRDADSDGVAEQRELFVVKQKQPFGMAQVGDHFYLGNSDGVVRFDYNPGDIRLQGSGEKLIEFKTGGHWTRSLLANDAGNTLYAGVGSLSNIGENGMDVEEGRAAIYEIDLETNQSRIFADGLRNAVGMAIEPQTQTLWTVVNERDGLGDEVPPDYLTSVQDGGFYGWPYCYWGETIDDRVEQDPVKVASAIRPDYALGGHTASLGLCWMPAGTLNGFDEDGMVIGQHGSWNRSKLSGYRVIFVPFADGAPAGAPRDILWGFLSDNEKHAYGRPVGVCIGPDNCLLVADDVGDVIWRVSNE